MRTLQEVGIEILNGTPQSLYIFAGNEYGIKTKYIEILKAKYANYAEVESLIGLIDSLSVKSLLPRPETLYVIRYDESLVSAINDKVVPKIEKCKIPGTVVMIYENPKHITKLSKHLDKYMVSIDDVDIRFKVKYLKNDFPHIDETLLSTIAKISDNYGEANTMAHSLSHLDANTLSELTQPQLSELFGKSSEVTDAYIRECVGSRSILGICAVLDKIDNYDNVLYTMLSALLDIEKAILKGNSDMNKYRPKWTIEWVYNMFNHTYHALNLLRSSNADGKYILLYLFSIMQIKNIPSYEVMKCY